MPIPQSPARRIRPGKGRPAPSAQNKKAKNWKVSNITSTLAGLQAVALVEEPARDLEIYELDNPRAKIIVKEKGRRTGSCAAWQNSKNIYANAADKATVVFVKEDEAGRLLMQLSELIE
jgi:carbon monoxide dehydrogenase subunit G